MGVWMVRALWALAAALLPQDPQASWTEAEDRRAEELLEGFYAKPEDRAGTLKELRKMPPLPADRVDRLSARALEMARKHGPKLEEKGGTLDHPKYKGKYLVKLPADFDPKKTYPLAIGLHGGGQNLGDAAWAEKAYGYMAEKGGCIGVYPEVLQKRYAEWGRSSEEAEYVEEVIDAAMRTWNIDTDRVYMMGDSMGGYGTWHIGGTLADRLSALGSHAGGILRLGRNPWGIGVIPNLRNTPIYFTHGAQDQPAPIGSDRRADQILSQLRKEDPGGYEHRYTEFPDRGHSIPRDELVKSMDWILERKRDANAKRLVWETYYGWKREFGWLKLDRPELGQKVAAEIKENRVELTLTKVNGDLRVRLNRELVDVSKPVTIVVDGRVSWEGKPSASVAVLAESALGLDARRLYAYEVPVREEY